MVRASLLGPQILPNTSKIAANTSFAGEPNASAVGSRLLWTSESLEVSEVFPDFSLGPWKSPAVCQVFSILLAAGSYQLEVWGASGGSTEKSLESAGGYSSGVLTLHSATRIFAVAGSIGETAAGGSRAVAGGCNGGGLGMTESDKRFYYSGGGGASHIAAVENNLSYRIIVAAGSGGSFSGNSRVIGGEGGGESGNDGRIASSHSYGSGEGATQTRPGETCAVSGSNGLCQSGGFGFGGSGPSRPGCGGGSGWFGGAASFGVDVTAGGGSGFVFAGSQSTGCSQIDRHPLIGKIPALKNRKTLTGKSFGNGSVSIKMLHLDPTASATPLTTPSNACQCTQRKSILATVLLHISPTLT